MEVATVEVVGEDGGPVRVNAADFDAKKHALWGAREVPGPSPYGVAQEQGTVEAQQTSAATVRETEKKRGRKTE